jgi:hypothetical protein
MQPSTSFGLGLIVAGRQRSVARRGYSVRLPQSMQVAAGAAPTSPELMLIHQIGTATAVAIPSKG